MTDTATATITLRWRADASVPPPGASPSPFFAARVTVQAEDSDDIHCYARVLAGSHATGVLHGVVDYTVQHALSGEVLAFGSVDIDAHNREHERTARAMRLLATLAHPHVTESVFREALADARAMLDAMKGEG